MVERGKIRHISLHFVKKFMDVSESYTMPEFNQFYDNLKSRYPKSIKYLEYNVLVTIYTNKVKWCEFQCETHL